MINQHIADTTNESLLQKYIQLTVIMLIQSGPGAGKSWLLIRMGILSLVVLEERALISVKTNRQAWAMLRNFARDFPDYTYYFVYSSTADLPLDLQNNPNIQCVQRFSDLPEEPIITVATGDKCAHAEGFHNLFDVMLIDEAYQYTDSLFSLISSFAPRWVLIGDSGQIKPVVQINTKFWEGNSEAPYLSAPEALQARNPSLQAYQLPVTRRIPADSIPFIQPIFYPHHPFVALSSPQDRQITFIHHPQTVEMANLVSQIQNGASILMVQLAHAFTPIQDLDMLNTVALTAESLLQLHPIITDGQDHYQLRPEDIGIACSNVIDVNHLQNRLLHSFPEILIETFHRFQGLERPIMLIVHPLSGQQELAAESMETGLLCVGLSRHRNLCLVFAREGLEQALTSSPSFGERCMNEPFSSHSRNWQTHISFLKAMKQHGRIISI